MSERSGKIRPYRRSHFVTRLPVDYRYSPSHCWVAGEEGNVWRVGFTNFATRMLGEMVDYGFEVGPGGPVQQGQIIGWAEGFKAISDLYCIGDGTFIGVNPDLEKNIQWIDKDPYRKGWLYRFEGRIDPKCMNVEAYVGVLDKTIDKILENQQAGEIK